MRKDATTITITTLVLGIFGAFFRWLQNLNAFEKDTGLALPGSGTSTAMVVYLLAALGVLLFLRLAWLRRFDHPTEAGFALRTDSVLPAVITWLLAAMTVLSSLVLMFTADIASLPVMQRIFAALGILAGLSLPFIFGKKGSTSPNPLASVTSIAPVLFGCFWLVFSYRAHAENPVLWSYAIEILAITATTLAFYYLCAYFYYRAKPQRGLTLLQIAVVLDITTLSDSRALGIGAIFAVMAAFLLLAEYVLISNMSEKKDDKD